MPAGLSDRRLADTGPRMLLTTDAVGGVWRYSVDLAAGLAERGVASVLAVLGPAPSAAQRAEAGAVPGLRLVETGLALDWTAPGPDVLAEASQRLATLAALIGVRSVHLHAPALVGLVRWPAPVVAVCHSCLGTWWRAMREGDPPADFTWRIAATAEGLRRAQAVVAPSAAQAAAMRAVYGPLEIAVVHNGVGGAAAQGRDARAVLTAGRLWDEAKGAVALDQVAAQVDGPVRAAGAVTGPNGAAVALHHVELLGPLDAAGMARAYGEASVFVSMARYEPFGLAVLEAARAGLRLVLADIPTFRELWDGVARFVPDAGGLARALNEALSAPGDGGARARAAAYTPERMVHGTLGVHRALVGLGVG